MSLIGQVNISSSDWAPCIDGVVSESSSSTLSLTYINFSSGNLYWLCSCEKLVKESSDCNIQTNIYFWGWGWVLHHTNTVKVILKLSSYWWRKTSGAPLCISLGTSGHLSRNIDIPGRIQTHSGEGQVILSQRL